MVLVELSRVEGPNVLVFDVVNIFDMLTKIAATTVKLFLFFERGELESRAELELQALRVQDLDD